MARYIAFWIWLFPLLAGAAAQDTVVGAPAEVPWDTLMAEIQVIESLEEADSLKDGQMKALSKRPIRKIRSITPGWQKIMK